MATSNAGVNSQSLNRIDDLIVNTTTVIPQTGGGTLTALRINELQDSNTYTLPLANTVSANQVIVIELPEKYKTATPTVIRNGSDTISFLSLIHI